MLENMADVNLSEYDVSKKKQIERNSILYYHELLGERLYS